MKRPRFHDDDAALLRFLRARKCDVDKAAKLFEDCLVCCVRNLDSARCAVQKWRESYKPEAITLEQMPREANSGKAYPLGKDKQKRPTWLVLPGRHEPKNSDNEEVVRALVYYVEQAIARNCLPSLLRPDVMLTRMQDGFVGRADVPSSSTSRAGD